MRNFYALPLVSLLALCSSCLRAPPAGSADAAVEPRAAPFAILTVEVRDYRGDLREPRAIPQRPVIRVRGSNPPQLDPDAFLLLRGAIDDGILDDLASAPLRDSTRARSVAVELTSDHDVIELRPSIRLAAGETVTLAVAAWARDRTTGERLREPWTRELTVDPNPAGGASFVESWPPHLAAGVAPTIPFVALRFDGPVENLASIEASIDGAPATVTTAAASCEELGFASDGFCARTDLPPITGTAAVAIVIPAAVRDATGAPIDPARIDFRTSPDPDAIDPSLLPTTCALDEIALDDACVLADDGNLEIALHASEPVRIELTLPGRIARALAPRGTARLRIDRLTAGREYPATLALTDLAGRRAERSLALRTADPLPALAIVEVRADPNGLEPRQEYVELLNYGAVSLDLEGLMLSDRADALGDALPPLRLAPGQRALVVGRDFDPNDPADPPVPPGVPLARVDRSIGSAGLSNGGEPVYLRSGSARLSAAPAIATRGAGICLVRVGDELRTADRTAFAWRACTPGAP